MYVFRAWITRNGERIYARDYGKKACRKIVYFVV